MKKWVYPGLSVLLIAGLWALVTPDYSGADLRQFVNRVGTNIGSSVQLGDNIGQDTVDVSAHLEVDSTAVFSSAVTMSGTVTLTAGGSIALDSLNADSIDVATHLTTAALTADGATILSGTVTMTAGGTVALDSLNTDSIDVVSELTTAALSADGAVTLSGGLVMAPVLLDSSDATTVILATNSGKLHVIPDMDADSDIALPTAAAGLYYEFMYGGAAADAHDHTIDTGADANFFTGGIAFIDLDAGAGADELSTVYPDGDSNSILTVNNIGAGTRILLWCNGTVWYLSSTVISDTAPSFADQS